MENGYEGRSDAADIINDEGRLLLANYAVHVCMAE